MSRVSFWLFLILSAWALVGFPPSGAAAFPAEASSLSTPTPPPDDEARARRWPVQNRFTVPAQGGPNLKGTPLPVWLPPAYPVPWAPTPHDHFFFGRVLPPSYEDIPILEYRFGAWKPNMERAHGGIDIPAPPGTPVLAIGSGRVIWAGKGFTFGYPRDDDPYGLAVVIRHDLGWQGHALYSLYAHMKTLDVRPGEWVVQGTPLGRVGSTGKSDGPHVHLEIRMQRHDEPARSASLLNPELWIAPPVGWGVLVGRLYDDHYHLWNTDAVTLIPLEWTPEVRALWQGRYSITTHTYARGSGVSPDPYYHENFALNNLPAGRYRLVLKLGKYIYQRTVIIYPGRATFFIFAPNVGIVVQYKSLIVGDDENP